MTWYHAIGPGHSLRRKNEPQGPEEADRQGAMTDIMAPLWTAWDTKDRNWSHSLASMTCWIMSLTMGVETEEDTGSGWLTINRNGTWVGCLNTGLPLLVRTDQLSCAYWPYPLHVVTLRTLDQSEMRCDTDILVQCLKTRIDVTCLDPESFSMAELRRATTRPHPGAQHPGAHCTQS